MIETKEGASLALFRQAIEATTDGVIMTDATREGHPIVYANPAFERMVGYKAHEILGRNCDFLLGEDSAQADAGKLQRAIADALPCVVVLRNYRRDGALFWNELSVSPVRDDDGRVTHFISIHKDVSARVKLEKSLREHQKQLEQANTTLSRMATHDALTDVANRRFFLDMFAREWRRASREAAPVSVLMIDIDFFKNYNDLYGHLAGDECLKRVAAALEEQLKRPADLLGRYGGEEFMALLPATTSAGAIQVAEAMRAGIEDLAIEHAGSRAADRVTVCIGATSELPGPGITMEALIDRADRAMYRAKQAGRNRIETEAARSEPGS